MQRISRFVAPLALATAAAANWAAWLGWDQKYDVHPDGHVTGPYEAWQVAGLVVVLAALVIGAALRIGPVAALAPTLGTAVAVCYDWSDDDSGLWVIGAGMIVCGLFFASVLALAFVGNARRVKTG